MKVQIKNCVTDPAYKELRQKGSPQFKPVILGQVLMPGATRVVNSENINLALATKIDSLVKSGSLLCHVVGVGSVCLVDHLGLEEPVEVLSEPEPAVEEITEEEPVIEEPSVEEESEEEQIGYSEEDLSSMKNADLRSIALSLDESAQVANKSKKKLVALILELQNV